MWCALWRRRVDRLQLIRAAPGPAAAAVAAAPPWGDVPAAPLPPLPLSLFAAAAADATATVAAAAHPPPPLTPPRTSGARASCFPLRLPAVVGASPAHRVALERACSLGAIEPSGVASPALSLPPSSSADAFPPLGIGAKEAAAPPEDKLPPAATLSAPPPVPQQHQPLAPALSASAAAAAAAAALLARELPRLLSPAELRARRLRRAADARERLHAAQRWIAARLRALSWERADVCAYHYQAHASIVLRDERFYSMPKDTLEFAARQLFG